ncbi:hypothetical protein PILCRDRAFT_182924 [Piloderma croceum F 1598]|uniref:Uncharacterized protein n=1 Tax=Piloderma croceum (strain F 1598) TaxID=765440 RepID=A0A0C3GIF3_PILCF|nr:hypothetical protein PILCRDRAFT_182924 [Piloderma croceum F 1598]
MSSTNPYSTATSNHSACTLRTRRAFFHREPRTDILPPSLCSHNFIAFFSPLMYLPPPRCSFLSIHSLALGPSYHVLSPSSLLPPSLHKPIARRHGLKRPTLQNRKNNGRLATKGRPQFERSNEINGFCDTF